MTPVGVYLESKDNYRNIRKISVCFWAAYILLDTLGKFEGDLSEHCERAEFVQNQTAPAPELCTSKSLR